MTTNNELEEKVESFFQQHQQDFIDAFKVDFVLAKQTPFEIGLYNSGNPAADGFQIRTLKFFNEELRISTAPSFQIPPFGTPEYHTNLKGFYAFEEKCETDFWSLQKNVVNFERLATFQAYQDITVAPALAKKYKNSPGLFDEEGWIKYTNDLLNFFYPDFEYLGTKKKAVFRYKDAAKSEFNLYLEYDALLFKKHMEDGELMLPDINILLVKKSVAIDFEKHNHFIHSSMLMLGKLNNPFINDPCSPIDVFLAQNSISELGPGEFEIISHMQHDILEDGNVHIYNSTAFGIKLQKHLYFYFAANHFFTDSYLNFLCSI
jgi:hypothetical protein